MEEEAALLVLGLMKLECGEEASSVGLREETSVLLAMVLKEKSEGFSKERPSFLGIVGGGGGWRF